MTEQEEKPAGLFSTAREVWGCPKAKHRWWAWHDFQWGMGPDATVRRDGLVLHQGGGWWMYCTKCGKGMWR